MAIIETLAISVGPAISKAILKYWLKDSEIALNITSSISDILSDKAKGIIAVRRGNRQFEEIGEKVAENLLPLFQDTRLPLQENELQAVALAVANTLETSGIDPKFLADRDLDPSKLTKYLMASEQQATRDLSEAGSEFYKRIISESSAYIIDISSQLPNFTERTFSEILERERLLINKVDQILDEVRRIREESLKANPEFNAARFEEDYRRAIVRKLDEQELFGVDATSSSVRHQLSVAYISLSVEKKSFELPNNNNQIIEVNNNKPTANNAPEDSESITSIADNILAGSQRLIIVGSAGSGKTTLLKWIAVRSAARDFDGILSVWNNTIPFFIQLRQCVSLSLPSPEEFPDHIVPSIAGTKPQNWVYSQLRSERAIVLIDGLDELPYVQRKDVRQWLKELVSNYQQTRFIITSRHHAIEVGWMGEEQFELAELQPMEINEINSFIDHWHKAVEEQEQDQEKKNAIEDLAEGLKKVLEVNRPNFSLATNPLLCALICALHRDRKAHLPSDRIELYEACFEMLLERRDIERKVALDDYPKMILRQKMALLQDLAYWMFLNNWNPVKFERAVNRLKKKLGLSGIPNRLNGQNH